jgi:hypothetical protein
MNYEQMVQELAKKQLVGKRIIAVNYMDRESADDMFWRSRGIIITLEGGIQLIPMSDDEGNDAGAMATSLEGELATIAVVQ